MPAPAVDCRAVVHELWDYLDGELPPERWDAISEHLAICTGCRGHVHFCRSFLTLVERAPATSAELTSLRERVLSTLRGS